MLFSVKLTRSATRTGRNVRWANFVGFYPGQCGTWTFASTKDAEAFRTYASQGSAPSLAADDLKAAGISLPVACDGWSIL